MKKFGAVVVSCLSFLLLSFIFIMPIQAKPTLKFTPDSSSLNVWKSSENSFTIEIRQLKIVVEQLSQAHYRLSYNQSRTVITYDLINDGLNKILFVNGVEAFRFPIKQVSTLQSDHNSTYWWDGIRFVSGLYIKYPHADRDYYGISPFSDWSAAGNKLYHCQMNQATSMTLNAGGGAVIGATIGGLIGTCIVGPPWGTLIGSIVAAIITAIMVGFGYVVFLDEWNCIWWWISQAFVLWLYYNYSYVLVLYYFFGLAVATAYTMSVFLSNGYLRIGSATFVDAVGAGNP